MLEMKVIDLEETIREWAQRYLDTTDKQKLIQTNHEKLVNNLKRQYKRMSKSRKPKQFIPYSFSRYDINLLYQSNA